MVSLPAKALVELAPVLAVCGGVVTVLADATIEKITCREDVSGATLPQATAPSDTTAGI